ncbi:hypothetical protein Aura_00045 [Pseudomonas phage vB_PpuM-Aura]
MDRSARDAYLTYAEKGETLKVHIIHKPIPGEPDFYKQSRSIEAFASRNGPTDKRYDTFWYYRQWKADFEGGEKFRRGCYEIDPGPLPEVHHSSVWEFYTSIGWDHRAKKFVEAAA